MAFPLPGGPDPDRERQQKFEALALAMPGFGGKSVEIRFGTSSLTYAANTTATTTGVTHGLGGLPVAIVALSHAAPAFGQIPLCDTTSWTTTTFSLNGELKTAYSGTITVPWIAIG